MIFLYPLKWLATKIACGILAAIATVIVGTMITVGIPIYMILLVDTNAGMEMIKVMALIGFFAGFISGD